MDHNTGEDLWVPANSISKEHEDIVLEYFDDGKHHHNFAPPPTPALRRRLLHYNRSLLAPLNSYPIFFSLPSVKR